MNTLSLFNDFFGSDLPAMYTNDCTVPEVDVTQNKDAYTLEMDLPGRCENDINLELNGRVLTISSKEKEAVKEASDTDTQTKDVAEKNDADADRTPQYLIRERRHVQFSRKFTLPNDIDGEKISAAFKNGVLAVSIPRKPAVEPRRISINVA